MIALQAEDFLNAFLELLANIAYLNLSGQRGASIEEDEEAEARYWAEFGNYQARFARVGTLENDE